MNRYLFLLIFFLTAALYAQDSDSVRIIIPADTLRTDTLSSRDSLALSDTLALLSDSLNLVKADTISPLFQQPFYNYSRFLNRHEFSRLPYTFAGDIFTNTPFIFNMSHGLAGELDNLMIYGSGSSSAAFLVNGINYSDFSSSPFNLNSIQEESADSIEILPLPRGFMYTPGNDQAVINFINRDFLSITPYTRIRYYEGPYGEGFIDGMFNSLIFKRINLLLDLSNKKVDKRFTNTDFSKWNGRIQLKYLLSNKVNLVSGYEYSNTNSGASGGIDVLNLPSNQAFLNAIYDEIVAPVVYSDLRFNTFVHTVYVKSLSRFSKNTSTDFSVYYRANRIELNTPASNQPYADNLMRSKITGAALNHDFKFSAAGLKLLGNFESADLNIRTGFSDNLAITKMKESRLSFGAVLSGSLIHNAVTPSVFCKILSEKISAVKNYSGYGADINIVPLVDFSLYAGYSMMKNMYLSDYSKNLQVSAGYKTRETELGISFFNKESSSMPFLTDTALNANSPYLYPSSVQGLSANFKIHFFKILAEGKADYYKSSGSTMYNFPSVFAVGGLYYKDSLFTGALDLKAGFDFYFYGNRDIIFREEFTPADIENSIGPDYRVDIFISGEIQGDAILFFTLENIFDWKYYLVPFYPMPPRGFRFGVSWELTN